MKDPWFFTGSLRASSITVYDTTLDWLAIGDSMGTKADNRYNSESMKTATEQKKKEEGARFVRYFGPLLDALRALGGSGTPDEVVERIALDVGLRDEVQNELLPSGEPRYRNQVAWARFYLVREGLLDSSRRGVWSLTDAVAQPSFRRNKHEKSFGNGFTIFRSNVARRQTFQNRPSSRWRERQR